MSKVEISLHLQKEVVEDANKFGLLTEERLTELLQTEIERRKEMSEEDWEEEVLSEAFGDALSEDGQVDFNRLRNSGKIVTPEELESISKNNS